MAACMKKNIENKPCAVFSSLPLVLSILAMVQPFHVFAKSEPIKIPELPASPGGPLEIRVGIQILNIYSIDSRTESFDADLYFWASWQDPKALEVFEKTAGSELVVSRETAWGGDQKLWNPYLELNTSSLASQDREVLTLYPSGKVEYGTRIVGQFKPPEGTMNFRMFPFDQHQLRIEASSFVYKSREVNFRADKELLKPDGPESIFEKVHMQEWKIRGAKILTQTEAFTGTDSDEAYSVIGFELQVVRKSSYYILRWIVPLVLILLLAWLALFTPANRLDVQASTVSAAFLSLVALNFVIASDLPHCEYLTLFDHGLVIAYISVLLIAIIIVGAAQIPEEAAQRLFHRARISLPILISILNVAGGILFSRQIADRITIWIDMIVFLTWAGFIGFSLLIKPRQKDSGS
jgi:hypothetical protein